MGVLVLDEAEWALILEKIIPKVGTIVLIEDLPTRIEDVLRMRRGDGAVTTVLQFAFISGKFRTTSKESATAVTRISM